jgi:hypothetical protein
MSDESAVQKLSLKNKAVIDKLVFHYAVNVMKTAKTSYAIEELVKLFSVLVKSFSFDYIHKIKKNGDLLDFENVFDSIEHLVVKCNLNHEKMLSILMVEHKFVFKTESIFKMLGIIKGEGGENDSKITSGLSSDLFSVQDDFFKDHVFSMRDDDRVILLKLLLKKQDSFDDCGLLINIFASDFGDVRSCFEFIISLFNQHVLEKLNGNVFKLLKKLIFLKSDSEKRELFELLKAEWKLDKKGKVYNIYDSSELASGDEEGDDTESSDSESEFESSENDSEASEIDSDSSENVSDSDDENDSDSDDENDSDSSENDSDSNDENDSEEGSNIKRKKKKAESHKEKTPNNKKAKKNIVSTAPETQQVVTKGTNNVKRKNKDGGKNKK